MLSWSSRRSPAKAASNVLLICSLLILLWEGDARARRLTAAVGALGSIWAQPNYTLYHHYTDLLQKVDAIVIANPDYMKVETLSARDESYAADMKVVTVEFGGFSDRQRAKARLLVDFGEHGREYISSELGLLFMQTLASPAKILEVFGDGNAQRANKLIQLLQGTVFKILPMENVGGRQLVETGKLCERKNGRGVDPNRNWPLDWGKKEKDYDPNEEYPGTKPFSEPEVQIVHKLATDFAPHVWLNIHSGMEAMFTPWDHIAEVPPAATAALSILKTIQSDLMQGTTCVVGSGGKSVGYLAHGTATDYMFEVMHVPMSYTWEIFGDFNADFHDCFRMFNPLSEKQVQDVLQRWLRALFRLVELLPSHPALANSTAWQLPPQQPAGGAVPAAVEQRQGVGQPASQAPGQQQQPQQVLVGGAPSGAHSQSETGTSVSGRIATPAAAAPSAVPAVPYELDRTIVVTVSRAGLGDLWASWYLHASVALAGLAVVCILVNRYALGGSSSSSGARQWGLPVTTSPGRGGGGGGLGLGALVRSSAGGKGQTRTYSSSYMAWLPRLFPGRVKVGT